VASIADVFINLRTHSRKLEHDVEAGADGPGVRRAGDRAGRATAAAAR
jgi:hypothetical protein